MAIALALVRRISHFADLPSDVAGTIAECGDLLRLGPAEEVFACEAAPPCLYAVLTGFIELYVKRAGHEVSVGLLGPGGMPALAATLLKERPVAAVRTATSAHLLAFPLTRLCALAEQRCDFAALLLRLALSEAGRLEAELLAGRTLSAVQRLGAYLLSQITNATETPARFVLGMEKKLLAIKLGCTQESLSRSFGALRGVGVTTRGPAIIVADPQALRHLVHGP